jgi:hypothetical protein
MDLNGFINVIIYKYRQKTIDRIEHDLTMEKWEHSGLKNGQIVI